MDSEQLPRVFCVVGIFPAWAAFIFMKEPRHLPSSPALWELSPLGPSVCHMVCPPASTLVGVCVFNGVPLHQGAGTCLGRRPPGRTLVLPECMRWGWAGLVAKKSWRGAGCACFASQGAGHGGNVYGEGSRCCMVGGVEGASRRPWPPWSWGGTDRLVCPPKQGCWSQAEGATSRLAGAPESCLSYFLIQTIPLPSSDQWGSWMLPV